MLSILTSLLPLLMQLGPLVIQEYETLKASGTADPATLAALKAQIDTLDTKRMSDWAIADSALTAAGAT